jgi:hypothetical protein
MATLSAQMTAAAQPALGVPSLSRRDAIRLTLTQVPETVDLLHSWVCVGKAASAPATFGAMDAAARFVDGLIAYDPDFKFVTGNLNIVGTQTNIDLLGFAVGDHLWIGIVYTDAVMPIAGTALDLVAGPFIVVA